MGNLPRGFAASTQRRSMSGFQVLTQRDQPKLEALFLGFDFDERRKYFGAGVSDASIRDYCRSICWRETTIIARSASSVLEAVAILTAPIGARIAELAIARAADAEDASVVADLLELSLSVASLSYPQLIVHREHASEELLAALQRLAVVWADDVVRIDVPCAAKIVTC